MEKSTQATQVLPTREAVPRLVGIGLVIVWLLVWEWSIRSGLFRRDIFFPPSAIAALLYQSLLVSGQLQIHLWSTMSRMIVGLVIGATPALLVGRFMGRNDSARLTCGPITAVLGLIPVIGAIPMYIVLFGVGNFSKWVMVAAAVFFPIVYTTMIGVRSCRAAEVAIRNPSEMIAQKNWPYNSRPWMFAGLKLGVVVGLATLLGAEMFISRTGLGNVIFNAGSKLDFAQIYVGIAAAAFVAYTLWLCIAGVEWMFLRSGFFPTGPRTAP